LVAKDSAIQNSNEPYRAAMYELGFEEMDGTTWWKMVMKAIDNINSKLPQNQGVAEGSELPVQQHKSPYEGSDDEHRYTTMFKASPNSAQRFAKHIISNGGKARIGKRGQDYYVYHNMPMSKEDWRKSEQQNVDEEKQRLDPKCWSGYKKQGTKMKGDTRVNNCVPVSEAEFNEDKLAQDLYKDLQIFKKGADKEIGPKAKDKEISSKAKDKEIIAKVTNK